MPIFSALVALVLLVCALPGCVSQPPPDVGPGPCDGPPPVPASGDALTVLLDAADAARRRHHSCGPSDDTTRVCRALWLQQMLDPAVIDVFATASQSERAAGLLGWALDDAYRVTSDDLRETFDQLRDANAVIRTAVDDAGRSAAIRSRARPAIVGPLRRAESQC